MSLNIKSIFDNTFSDWFVFFFYYLVWLSFKYSLISVCDVSSGFFPSLKRLLGTPAYFLLLCGSILKFNSFIGLFTFKAKYMEQQFGQSASRANFLIGKNLSLIAYPIKTYITVLLLCR